MNQNPVIRFDSIPASFREVRKHAVISLLIYGAVIVGFVAAALYMVSASTGRMLVLTEGAPMVVERMTKEDALMHGYINDSTLTSIQVLKTHGE